MKPSSLTLRSALFLYLLAISVNGLVAQIQLSPGPGVTPAMMVESILMDGVSYSNVNFQGANHARGIFSNGETTNLGISGGIFLTSGTWYYIPGPNNTNSASAGNGFPGHPLLSAVAGTATCDAAVLSFKFVAETDTLQFRYVFGSEEYNEWVGYNFNDVFGLFISGPNPTGGNYSNRNIAIIPGTINTGISVNTVNNGHAYSGTLPTGPCMNCEYFSDNTGGLTLQYDAKTVVMTAWVHVVPCEEYSIIIGVADGVSCGYDAGGFVEENSVGFPKVTAELVLDPPDVSDIMIEGCVSGDVIFRLPHAGYAPYTLTFEIQGTAINGVDYEHIDWWVNFPAGSDSASIKIVPLYDGLIEGLESIILILENTMGCVVRYDTIMLYFDDYIDMVSVTSPDPMICPGQETEISVTVYNGLEPHFYTWEPGTLNGDIVTVNPDTTTWYFVTITDMCLYTITDSVMVKVMPGHMNDLLSFTFKAANNPGLPEDISGIVTQDSVLVTLPSAQGIDNLVATFIASSCAEAYVDGEIQISGFTANDFTFPVIYKVMAANGDIKEWVVKVDFLSGQKEWENAQITIYPNPAKDRLQITGASGYEVSLFNAFGVKLLQETITEKNTFLDVRNIEPGIYYLKFGYENHRFVRKVVITK